MGRHRTVTHVYAVLRLDPDLSEDVRESVTVKELHPTLEMAQAEVDRLNQLAMDEGRNSIYWWQTTRWRGAPLPGTIATDAADGSA